ncbi:alpha/beta hydrolase family protein [Paraconexibacter sp.]|uniref:alpha/beta hydrolase family protein n=1 Tax=Paraconexibacter sp. TaxID=2949640 RepID=UPI00356AD2A2
MGAPGTRIVTVDPPEEEDRHRGLRYSLFVPTAPPHGAILVLHGAGSTRSSHHDYARSCRDAGFAAMCFDQRGHGDSDGPMDQRVVEDVVGMAAHLRDRVRSRTGLASHVPLPLGLRGSSMGGYLALVAASPAHADAVVAICPASADGLADGLRARRFDFRADVERLQPVLEEHDALAAAAAYRGRLLLLHAEGDESVPVAHSRALHAAAPGSRLIVVPGGHHRSIQHDAELQGETLRFFRRAFGPATTSGPA